MSIYTSKLETGVSVLVDSLGALPEDARATLLDSWLGASEAPALQGLVKAYQAFTTFALSEDDQARIDKLQTQAGKLEKIDPQAVIAEKIASLGASISADKIMAHMSTLQKRIDARQKRIDAIKAELDTLQDGARLAALEAYTSTMLGRTDSKSTSTRASNGDYEFLGKVIACPYDRGKRTMHVAVIDAKNYRVWKAHEGNRKIIAYNSTEQETPVELTSLSTVRKVMDCVRKGLEVSPDNMAKQTLGIGVARDDGKGGSYAFVVHENVRDWEKARREENTRVKAEADKTKSK